MPFKSEKQRRYMFAKQPKIAKRWAKKYPTKDLPMYADNADKEKRAVLGVLGRVLKNNLQPAVNFSVSQSLGRYLKKADSKLEHIQMPQHAQPTYSGEKPINSVLKPETEDEGSVGDVMAQESQSGGAKELLRKIALVAGPEVVRETERRKAQQTGQTPQPVPNNVNVKQYPVSPTTPPPMDLNAPAPAQQAAPQQQPAPNPNTTPAVGGGASPNARPIDAFGGISATGDLTGNSAQGVQHAAGAEKQSNEPIDFDKWHGKAFKIVTTPAGKSVARNTTGLGDGTPIADDPGRVSIVTPENGASWDWPDAPAETVNNFKKNWAQIQPGVGGYKMDQIRRAMQSQPGAKPVTPPPVTPPPVTPPPVTPQSIVPAEKLSSDDILAEIMSIDGSLDPTEQLELDEIWLDNLRAKCAAALKQQKCSCGCGQKVAECTCSASCSCRQKNGSCYGLEVKTAGSKPGLWANIHAKRKRGGKPAKPGDQDYPDSKSWQKTVKSSSSPAWQRSAGKNPEGGLNEKGRKSYERETGGNLKAPVTEKNPTGKAEKRQNSFCSRMCGMKRVNTGAETKADPGSRINKSLRKWNCKCGSALEFGRLVGEKVAAELTPAPVKPAPAPVAAVKQPVDKALQSQAKMFPNMVQLARANNQNQLNAIDAYSRAVHSRTGKHPSMWEITEALSAPDTGFSLVPSIYHNK